MINLSHEIETVERVLEVCIRQYKTSDTRVFKVLDRERGHFLVIEERWIGAKHLYNPFVHIEIQNKKIWVQQDYTNQGIANDLVKAGISPTRIVLGYRAPSERQDVEYSVT